jgi:hypothetical protein
LIIARTCRSGLHLASGAWQSSGQSSKRELEELIQLVLDIDIKDARILVNKMNVRARIFMVTNLLQGHIYSIAAK